MYLNPPSVFLLKVKFCAKTSYYTEFAYIIPVFYTESYASTFKHLKSHH